MSFLRPVSGQPQILFRPQSSVTDTEWFKTAKKVGLAAAVVIASFIAFTKFSILPALVVTGVTALLAFALHSCFNRCFPRSHNGEEGNDEPVRGREPSRRHPRDRVYGGRDENENRGARGFGDFLSGLFGSNRRGNLESGDGERHVRLGSREVSSPERGERSSARGNLGSGGEKHVRLGRGEVLRKTRHHPGLAGRGTPMPGLVPGRTPVPKSSDVGGRSPRDPTPVSSSSVGGRSPRDPAPTPTLIPGQNIPVGGGLRLPPTPPATGVPATGGERHVGLGTREVTGTPVRRREISSTGKIIVGGGKK